MPAQAEYTLNRTTFEVVPDPSQHRPFASRFSSDDFSSSVGDAPSVSSGASTVMPALPSEPVLPTAQWPFYNVFAQSSAAHVDKIPLAVANGLERRGWGDMPREAIVLPISAEGDGAPDSRSITFY